jgi:hypothetical protein
MTGRAEIDKQKKRLDATFERARKTMPDDAELLSDFARYFCVLVAGFLEQAMIEVALEHVRTHSHISVQRHVDTRLRRFTSANTQNIIELLGSFEADWRIDLEGYIVDEYKDAINSVISLRHTIAHGRYVGVTMVSVKDYYERVKNVVDHVADLCIP